MSKLIILADHSINIEYIAKNLCENRTKPESKCNGKCHLKKQLAKDENSKDPTSKNQQQPKFETPLFFQAPVPSMPEFVIAPAKLVFPVIAEPFFSNYTSDIFHPPSA